LFQRTNSVRDVGRIQFDSNVTSAQPLRDESDGPRSEERIENEIGLLSRRKNTRFNQRLGKCGDMGAAGIQSVDVPDRTPVPLRPILCAFFHRFVIVVVLLGLGEHEEIFMCSSRAVLDTLGHHIWLVPDDVASEKPAAVLQGEGESPWNSEQILIL
jgi:hypothetical protein